MKVAGVEHAVPVSQVLRNLQLAGRAAVAHLLQPAPEFLRRDPDPVFAEGEVVEGEAVGDGTEGIEVLVGGSVGDPAPAGPEAHSSDHQPLGQREPRQPGRSTLPLDHAVAHVLAEHVVADVFLGPAQELVGVGEEKGEEEREQARLATAVAEPEHHVGRLRLGREVDGQGVEARRPVPDRVQVEAPQLIHPSPPRSSPGAAAPFRRRRSESACPTSWPGSGRGAGRPPCPSSS